MRANSEHVGLCNYDDSNVNRRRELLWGDPAAPVPLWSIPHSLRVLSWAGLASLSMYGKFRGEPHSWSLPAHRREFVYVSLLPSSCQEAPQRGTADYSVQRATPSRLAWLGWCCTQDRGRALQQHSDPGRSPLINYSSPNISQSIVPTSFIKRAPTESLIHEP